MNENREQENIYGAIFVLFVVFALFFFLLNKFGQDKEVVTNPDAENLQNQGRTVLEKLDPDNSLLDKYLKEIYDSKAAGEKLDTEYLSEKYKVEVDRKLAIPEYETNIQNIIPNTKINLDNYNLEFEKLFTDFKNNGGLEENNIFIAQINNQTTLMQLSDFDRETLLKSATEYEKFSQAVENLPTPKVYVVEAGQVANKALQIKYILEKMINENDQKIYTLWIK